MQGTSTLKTRLIYFTTLLLGYLLFIIPNIVFGVFKGLGGFSGINLAITGIFQCISVLLLLRFSLKSLGKDFSYIGFSLTKLRSDILLGLAIGLGWLLLQFFVIIPNTGGAERTDISQMLTVMDGSVVGLISYIILGVVGGGITEELFNRGYTINVLKDTFKNPKTGLMISVGFSIFLFCLGHLPTGPLMWFDILIPTIGYTALFLYTKRLTASIVAHAIYNSLAILAVYYMYY